MKQLTILFLFLFSVALYGQDFDFIIDPIETEKVQPSSYEVLESGSYAPKLHETYQNRGLISQQLKRKVIVYIHDTAGEFDNEYLTAARNELGSTFTGEDFTDGHGHGTHVAGIVGAYSKDIPLGVAAVMAQRGLLWLIPYKVLSNSGGGRYSWVAESLTEATEKGIKQQKEGAFIIHSLSLGGSSPDNAVQLAINEAQEAGQMVIIAAGNTGNTPIGFPGRARNAHAIGAVDALGHRASFSSYGKEMYVAGAGVGILSTKAGGGLVKMSGTSMATPAVSGFIAVIASTHPTATANQISRFVARYGTNSKWDQFTGYGIPKYSNYTGHQAADEKDEPLDSNEPPTEDVPTREKRELTFDFADKEIFWKPMSGKFNTLYIDNLKVTVITDKYDEWIYDAVKNEVNWFFKNRALVVKDEHGYIDAAYWSARFAEMLINNRESDLQIKIEFITVHDTQGRNATVKRKGLTKFNAKVNLLVNPTIYTFDYKW